MAKQKKDIRLDDEIIHDAEQTAAREGLTFSDILRRWIRKGKQTEEANK